MDRVWYSIIRGTVGVFLMTLAACATQEAGQLYANTKQTTAKVEEIDLHGRQVFLKDSLGNRFTVLIDPRVENLAKVKVGDQVIIGYYEALAAEIKDPGEGVKGVKVGEGSSITQSGERPAGSVGRSVKATVKVLSVNQDTNTVMISSPSGHVHTVEVRNPRLQKYVKKLEAGDEVELTYTEAVAVTVEPVKK
ncbi:hypothetical protein [Methylocaldum sp.]|uniref:hypothetical protein n=1 Tax=Methylocaldum sp. TaxID=1969727 RepID=UPI002D2A8A09|nr:hypothetical protein [Methylocaldum sp.]HYE37450.1 hypothetical protein [Methylocaldum sp.]